MLWRGVKQRLCWYNCAGKHILLYTSRTVHEHTVPVCCCAQTQLWRVERWSLSPLSAVQRDQERWWKSELQAHSCGWEWWGYLSKVPQEPNSWKLLTHITTCPELFFNHSYLCPAVMSSVTALLLLPWASGSLRLSPVSLLQHLHLAINLGFISMTNQIQLTVMSDVSTVKLHKNLFVRPRQLHQSGEEERPISHLTAQNQGPLGDACTSRCWGAREG